MAQAAARVAWNSGATCGATRSTLKNCTTQHKLATPVSSGRISAEEAGAGTEAMPAL
ncbi:hypothetical protein GALL_471020 [mine drainage metagenome]|uniref:Uncharacterized protein n=1 Tax=mine drainage metagenome TaxID=410659 RepID=A0A1J5PKF0_9ZZZZ